MQMYYCQGLIKPMIPKSNSMGPQLAGQSADIEMFWRCLCVNDVWWDELLFFKRNEITKTCENTELTMDVKADIF